MFDVIVVGTDGSTRADAAVRHAIDLAELHDAALHVVSAYKPQGVQTVSASAGEVWEIHSRDHVDRTLEAAAATARVHGVPVEVHARQTDPARAVLDVATAVGADVVVVGNKGMTGPRGRLLGSVPNSIAHGAPCAVLILKTS